MMMVKIFLRHLFCSIRKRPIQPILLIIIIALGMEVCLASLFVRDFLYEDNRLEKEAEYGKADYYVQIGSLSDSRFLTMKEVEKEFGEDAVICGSFSLPLHYGSEKNFVFGVAVDLQTIDEFFDFEFKKYMPLPQEEAEHAFFATETFCEESGCTLGSTIELDILGCPQTFTLYGISEQSFLKENDIMIDLTGVTTQWMTVPSLCMMKEEIMPYATLYVKTDRTDAFSVLSKLFPTEDVMKIESSVSAKVQIIIIMVIVVSLIFAVATIYVCCSVIKAQRVEENNLLYVAGAKRYMLNWASLAEIFLYWLIGGLIGVLMSYPTAQAVVRFGGFIYCEAQVNPLYVGMSLFIMLVASELGMSVFCLVDYCEKFRKRREKKEIENEKVKKIFLMGIPSVCVVLGIISTLLSARYSFPTSIVGYMLFLFFSVFGGKNFFIFLSTKLSDCGKFDIPLRYGLKNISRKENLSYVSAIVIMFILVVFSICCFIVFVRDLKSTYQNILPGEYLVSGADSELVEELEKNEDIKSVEPILFNSCFVAGKEEEMVLSFQNLDTIDTDVISMTRLPEKDEVFIAKPFADIHDLEVGDYITMRVSGKELNLKVAVLLPINIDFFFIDADYWNISTNFHVVDLKGEITSSDYLHLVDVVTTGGGSLIPYQEVVKVNTQRCDTVLFCGDFMLVFISLFACIGIGNTVVSGYRSRKEEFDCYSASGMGQKTIRKMKGCELVCAFLYGIIMPIFFCGILYYFIYECATAYAIDMTYIFL